jgi:hypothetical protein
MSRFPPLLPRPSLNLARGELVSIIRWIALSLTLFAALIETTPTAAKSSHPKSSAQEIDRPTDAIDALRDAGGTMTPAVRAAYFDWAKGKILDEINASATPVPEEVQQELSHDATLADAMFVSVYPPDASILRNYISLREKLGPPFVQKYRSLVIASAVAHRTAGVTKRDAAEDAPPDAEDLEAGESVPEPEVTVESKAPSPFVSAIADYMKTTHSTALEIFEQPSKQQSLIQFARDSKVDEKDIARLEKTKIAGRRAQKRGNRNEIRHPIRGNAAWHARR